VSPLSYRQTFYDSGIPMAIATMDGCFVDCNKRFLETSTYTLAELKRLTVFNLTAHADLQVTYTKVSQMLQSSEETPSFESRAVLKYNQERGKLSVSMVRDERRRPAYFSVCLLAQERDVPVAPVPPAVWHEYPPYGIGMPQPSEYLASPVKHDWGSVPPPPPPPQSYAYPHPHFRHGPN